MSETVEINGKQFTEEELREFAEHVIEVWSRVKDVISQMAVAISEAVETVAQWINERRTERKHDYNWHVPMNTSKLPQIPRVPFVAMPCIRNNI